MGRVVVVTTGGTIASLPDKNTGLYSSGAMGADDLVNKIHLDSSYEVKTEDLFHISSNAMSFEYLYILKDTIREILKSDDVIGVVVTHGTDTLEETAYFLSLCIHDEKPVVITGSQRTPQEIGSDALSNLNDAIIAAASRECRGLGVIVQFNEGLYSARYVRKIHSFNPDAFSSLGFGMLGYVDGGRVHIVQTPVCRETYDCSGQIPRVDIVKAYLGCDGALITASANSGAKGIILEGFGRGHFPPGGCDAIGEAAAGGYRRDI